MISSSRILFVVAAALTVAATPALAKKCEYYKNGECYKSTTYVYKYARAKSYTDVSGYTKPDEKCRAICMRDAFKWGTTEQQTAYFNMCKRNKGCE